MKKCGCHYWQIGLTMTAIVPTVMQIRLSVDSRVKNTKKSHHIYYMIYAVETSSLSGPRYRNFKTL